MILTLFDYGALFYRSVSVSVLNEFQTLQNKAIRIICGLPKRENTDSLHKKLNLMFLSKRQNLHLLLMAHNLSFQSKYVKESTNLPSIKTRSKDPKRRHLLMFTPNTTLVESSFSYQIRRAWNSLPTAAHCCTTRKELNKFLLEHPEFLE